MPAESSPTSRPPIGIRLVCLLLVLYGTLWLLSWGLGGLAGNGLLATVAPPIALGVLILAYSLYRRSFVAWAITLALVGASTLWRLARVLGGRLDDLSNAVVGLVIVAYLLAKHEFFRAVDR
ncbi:MAG: hypothetical protein ACI9YT_000924 [Halobacteriales archaeon]|jgi:hypothetical protein